MLNNIVWVLMIGK